MEGGAARKVLNVTESDASRYLFTRMLEQAGYAVEEAATAKEALSKAREEPDLMLLDVHLPDISGYEVCRRIKRDPATASITVVHTSAVFTTPEKRVMSFESGADSFLMQPIDHSELVATLRALLRARKAEHEALTAARAWQRTFDAISQAVCILDQRGRVVRCNDAMLDVLQRRRSEVLGAPFRDVVCGAFGAILGQPLASAAEKNARTTADLQLGYRWFEVSIEPLADESAPAEEVLVLTNFTERKQREEAQAREAERREELLALAQVARAEAEATSRMKDEFLATISHELRTPLMAMLGWAMLVQREDLPAATRARGLATLERNIRLQTKLVEDLLDASRAITGKLRLEHADVDLLKVTEAAVDTLRPIADGKQVRVSLVVQGDPRGARCVRGDPSRLQQVVWNLVSNAVKFTPAGGLIAVALRFSDAHVELSVRDDGQGIRADFLPYVFDRFRQADNSITRSQGGLGLGLAITRHIVELHSGHVRAESPGEGLGATFLVTLPLRPATQALVLPSAAREPVPLYDGTERMRLLESVRVLLAEDDDDSRGLLTEILQQHGAEVVAVASAAEALEAFGRAPPAVLVSDIGMPEMDGYALLRELRASHAPRVPAIALTGYASVQDCHAAHSAGFQLHIAKPIEPADLVAKIIDLVRS